MSFNFEAPFRDDYLGPGGIYRNKRMRLPGSKPSVSGLGEYRRYQRQMNAPDVAGFNRAVKYSLAWDIGLAKGAHGWEFLGAKTISNQFKADWAKEGLNNLSRAGILGKAGGQFLFRAMGPVWLASSLYQGYEENGIMGAAAGGMSHAAFTVLGTGALRSFAGVGTMLSQGYKMGLAARTAGMMNATKGGWMGAQASGAYGFGSTMAMTGLRAGLMVGARLATRSLAMLPVVAPPLHMAMQVNQTMADINAGHRSMGINTTASLAAFATKGAWTSRQMSVAAIQRSHLNARSALGNEAQYMHRRGF